MTLPFENDTSPIIKRLAKQNWKADRNRNILIIVTIALATCLIVATTLFFFGTQRASLNDAAGRYQASISDLNYEKVRTIQSDNRVQAGVSYLLGMISYGDYKLTVRTMDENLMRLAKYPDMEGRLPETENEIAVTQAFLSRAGLEVGLGDTLSFNFGTGEQNYEISGILPVQQSNYSIYISPAYVENNIETPLYTVYLNRIGTDGWSKAGIQTEILNLAEEWGINQEQVQFSTHYFSLIQQRSSEYMMVITLVSLVIILACVLVIYSLFFVSIIRKTNEYGKLRTIGATKKQVKKVVFREGRHFCAVAIPIGAVFGMIAGYILVPDGWNMIMAGIVVLVIAVLMLLCVKLAIVKPAKIASSVTPIEALRYLAESNERITKSTPDLHQPLFTIRLALLNFSRNKKKTVLTILSLGMCGVLLMASSAYFNSIDPLNMARKNFPYGEIRIELGDYGPQAHTSEQFYSLQEQNILSGELIQKLQSIDGVEGIRTYQGTVLNVTIPTGQDEPLVAEGFSEDYQELLNSYLIAGTADWLELIQRNGIVLVENESWGVLFGWDVAVGDKVTIETGAGTSMEVTVMGIVDDEIPYGGYNTLFMPSKLLSSIMPLDDLNYQVILDTDDDRWEEVEEEVRRLVPTNSRTYITTLNDWVETFRSRLDEYRIPVYIFVVFIGVFGAINLLNTLMTNLVTRKRELGILQAVGLSSRQLSQMLLVEGLLYTLGIFLMAVTFGTLMGFLLCQVFSAMSIFGKVSYQFPMLEILAFFVLILMIQMVFSNVSIKQLKKKSLVDQIRELE